MVANRDRSVKPEASLLGLIGPKRPLKASPRGLLVSATLDECISIYIYDVMLIVVTRFPFGGGVTQG